MKANGSEKFGFKDGLITYTLEPPDSEGNNYAKALFCWTFRRPHSIDLLKLEGDGL